MQQLIGIALFSTFIITGCQSTASNMTSEEQTLVKSVCRTGDNGGSNNATWDEHKQSILDCGGFDIFTEDMVLEGERLRTNSKGKTRVFKRHRQLLAKQGGFEERRLHMGNRPRRPFENETRRRLSINMGTPTRSWQLLVSEILFH